MKNGKAVLCEKPVAMNARQFKIMIQTAKEMWCFLYGALWTRLFLL